MRARAQTGPGNFLVETGRNLGKMPGWQPKEGGNQPAKNAIAGESEYDCNFIHNTVLQNGNLVYRVGRADHFFIFSLLTILGEINFISDRKLVDGKCAIEKHGCGFTVF